MHERELYEENVKAFERVLSTQADQLLTNNDKAVVYIGKSTCPYCCRFVKKLNSLVDEVDTTIYYVDSNNFSDEGLGIFRNKYNIRTVPGFIVHKNGEIEVRCDSSTPESEILAMIK